MSKYLYLTWDLLYFFNALLFTLVAFHKRRTSWGGWAYGALIVTCAILYFDKIALELGRALLHRDIAVLRAVLQVAGLAIPSMLACLFYANESGHVAWRGVWKAVLWLLCAGGAAGTVLVIDGRAEWLRIALSDSLAALAGACGCGLLSLSRRDRRNSLDRNQRRWLIAICGALVFLCILDVVACPVWLGMAVDALPLCFLLVVTYYVERFTFFDILIKKGAFVFCSYVLLTLYFVFVPPRLLPWTNRTLSSSWFGTFVWSASVWPVVLLAPWGHRKLSAWLDRLWLGRRFAPAEAGKYFMAGLEGAIDTRELVERAGTHLSAIFQSHGEVRLDCSAEPGCDGIRAPIRSGDLVVGTMLVRPRPHNIRFLSEDAALLSSLAEIFSFLLENLRLREKRLAQEQRERELILNANRSELKALRAQINPHFLFNALNTIAGLIPRSPERAERTIEQLAEVFRYTLRRSDREWVRLEDELAAVRAYLDIEQTRFRERLRVAVSSSDSARNWRIPAMTVQTLVENAVKHGVAEIKGPAVVEVQAEVAGAKLRVEVRDNGPGFPQATGRGSHGFTGGFGLRNIRERLAGHFGGEARLEIGRDDGQGMTVVRLEMPEVKV